MGWDDHALFDLLLVRHFWLRDRADELDSPYLNGNLSLD
jgi:hypothetical protein